MSILAGFRPEPKAEGRASVTHRAVACSVLVPAVVDQVQLMGDDKLADVPLVGQVSVMQQKRPVVGEPLVRE